MCSRSKCAASPNNKFHANQSSWVTLKMGILWSSEASVITNRLEVKNSGKFLIRWGPVSFSGRTLLHAVRYNFDMKPLPSTSRLQSSVTTLCSSGITRVRNWLSREKSAHNAVDAAQPLCLKVDRGLFPKRRFFLAILKKSKWLYHYKYYTTSGKALGLAETYIKALNEYEEVKIILKLIKCKQTCFRSQWCSFILFSFLCGSSL
jgi:hypothetical protein